MGLRTGLWIEVTTSEYAHERAALDFIRRRLPDRDPFRAWANFTFIAEDGARNEVDVLVVSPTGVYLIEVKSHPGRMEGDAGTWVWVTPDGKRKTLDNPLLLAERKAKKLKSLLLRQSAFKAPGLRGKGFYLKAVVFLADPGLTVALNEAARSDIYGPDSDGSRQANQLPGIGALLTDVDARRGAAVDRTVSRAIAQAMEQAGIRESTAHRKVGEYELKELLDEGEGWQDYVCQHPQMKGTSRRIRIYLAGSARSDEERKALVRAAEREFKFLEGIDHPGIERPLEIDTNPRGPALIFAHKPDAQRLDHWLADHAEELDLLDRIELVRNLAETLRHAHRQGLYHRALSPHNIFVARRDGKPWPRIRNWQTAARHVGATSTTGSPTGTVHVADLVSSAAQIYVAPETLRLADSDPGPADMWSLGAASCLILSGQAPAADLDGLYATLRDQGCLSLAAAMDAPDKDLDFVIGQATQADAASRFVSVDEFLQYLDIAVERLTAPEERDPLDAGRGDVIADTWKVVRRFGSGSTSVVLLTERDGRPEVLKIARDDENAKRLQQEYDILTTLRDRLIVATYGFEEIAGRAMIRLEAALGTVAQELRDNGPLTIDRLERFGQDLLDALVLLEDEGIAHRDIKPDNLGIAERGKNRERHVILLDFSLSRTDPTNLRSGTAGYLDPFLEEREPRRWDLHAERYAAAVTLYEMTTGVRPIWGDGSTDPLLTDLKVPSLDDSLFDPSIRLPLVGFFDRAFNRIPASRFDTAVDMREAWRRVFSDVDQPATTTEDRAEIAVEDIDLTRVQSETPIVELGLSARVRNAIERLDVDNVASLAAIPPSKIVRLAGIGATTRREISHLAQRLRRSLADLPVPATLDGTSVDRIAEQLVSKPPADENHRAATEVLLGLVEAPEAWPTIRSVADRTGLGRETVAEALSSARSRWRNRSDITAVRSELVELLRLRDGIASGIELAAAFLVSRGSLAAEPIRSRRARAVVRAAVEAEGSLQEPRFVLRRVGEVFLVSLEGEMETEHGPRVWNADALTDAAAALGEVADALVVERPLPSLDRILSELRQVELGDGVGPFSDARLVRLAAASSATALASSRLELYPRDMPAEQAIAESRSALLDRVGLSAKEVRDRIRVRFPEVAPIPGRPELDRLLQPIGLRWSDEQRTYVTPRRGGILPTTFSRSPSTTTFASPDDRDAAITEIDERLDRLNSDGGFLALTVDRRFLPTTPDVIARRLGGVRVELDAWIIEEMKAQATASKGKWEAFVRADAAPPTDIKWARLRQLVDRALPNIEDRLKAIEGTAVLTGIGLLARYDRLSLLEHLRDQLTRASDKHPLRGLVIVVPGSDPKARPTIDGSPIPILTANQWAHLPSAWLQRGKRGDAA